ncbi:hypothetical protein BG58_33045 [Caballeronia jiangsuensis]|nr:hypothetical protein BG58_33045 [Caballeronia jiangsuensis]
MIPQADSANPLRARYPVAVRVRAPAFHDPRCAHIERRRSVNRSPLVNPRVPLHARARVRLVAYPCAAIGRNKEVAVRRY